MTVQEAETLLTNLMAEQNIRGRKVAALRCIRRECQSALDVGDGEVDWKARHDQLAGRVLELVEAARPGGDS